MPTGRDRRAVEWLKCSRSLAYFVTTYLHVYNATDRAWIPFALWPAQRDTLDILNGPRLVVILKARQLGLSWLVLAYALWMMLFRPAAAVLIFSRRDEEAVDLLDFRLKGMYARLPLWMQARAVQASDKHNWQLSNGSSAKSFPTTGGRSYTGSLVIVDEADWIPDLDDVLDGVKPAIDAGGRLVMLSTVDKQRPHSAFKRIYRASKAGANNWRGVFLPWTARPGRDEAWYAAMRADIVARDGALDSLWQEYPATDTEALAPNAQDKRIPSVWLEACYQPAAPLTDRSLPAYAPALPGLTIYRPVEQGHRYVIGVDPAEGNPTSDESAATVLDARSGEEVASLAGRFEPAVFASYIDQLGRWYAAASVLVERNNHGHAVLLWLRDNSRLTRLRGHDGQEGWLSSSKGKALLYARAADAVKNGETILHSFETLTQLASIEGATLRAPEGDHDDRADAYALALVAASTAPVVAGQTNYLR